MVFHGENHLGEPTMSAPYCTPKLLVIPIWNHSLGGYNQFHPYPNIPQRTRFVLLSNDGIRVWLKICYIHQDPMDDHRFPHGNGFTVVNHQFSDAPIYHIKIYMYTYIYISSWLYPHLVSLWIPHVPSCLFQKKTTMMPRLGKAFHETLNFCCLRPNTWRCATNEDAKW